MLQNNAQPFRNNYRNVFIMNIFQLIGYVEYLMNEKGIQRKHLTTFFLLNCLKISVINQTEIFCPALAPNELRVSEH